MATRNTKKQSTGPKKKARANKCGKKPASAKKKSTASRRRSPASTASNYSAALKWYRKGDFDRAWKACQSLASDVNSWQETDADTLLLASYVALRAGHFSAAHELLDAASSRNVKTVTCEFVAANVALAFNRPEEALAHCRRALTLLAVNPNLASRWLTIEQVDPQLNFVAGQANYSTSRLTDAAAAFSRVTDLQPGNQYGYLHLALTLKAQGKVAEARDIVAAGKKKCRTHDDLNKYDPGEETTSFILLHGSSQPRACYNLGLIYEELGRDIEAEENFKRIFERCDTFQDLFSHLALVNLRLANYSEAEEYAKKRLQENDDDNNARQLLAQACYRQQKFDEARTICRHLLETNVADTIAMELLIAIERADNDDDTALNWIEELLYLEPDNITGLQEKADIFAVRNEIDKALALYEKLHQIQPRNAEFINDLANCYFRMDEFKEAVRFYSEALAIKPQLKPSLRNLGLTYLKLGERDKAIEKLANYLDYNQIDSDILYLTARLYFDKGSFADAIRYVEQCLQLNPSSAELTALLADCYLKLGHVKSAQLGYQKALAIDPEFSPAAEMLKLIETSEMKTEASEEIEKPIKS